MSCWLFGSEFLGKVRKTITLTSNPGTKECTLNNKTLPKICKTTLFFFVVAARCFYQCGSSVCVCVGGGGGGGGGGGEWGWVG